MWKFGYRSGGEKEERFRSRVPFFTRLKAIGIERYIVNQDNWQGGDYFVDSTMLRKRFFRPDPISLPSPLLLPLPLLSSSQNFSLDEEGGGSSLRAEEKSP